MVDCAWSSQLIRKERKKIIKNKKRKKEKRESSFTCFYLVLLCSLAQLDLPHVGLYFTAASDNFTLLVLPDQCTLARVWL